MTRRSVSFAGLMLLIAIAALAQKDKGEDLVIRAAAAETAGDYATAAGIYRDGVRLAETLDKRDFRRAFALNGLGLMQDTMGQFADADKTLQAALTALDRA